MDDPLFAEALERALRDPEISPRLDRLSQLGFETPQFALRRFLVARREEIASAAVNELNRLEEADRSQVDLEEQAVEDQLRSDPGLRRTVADLRRQVETARSDDEQDQTDAAELEEQLEELLDPLRTSAGDDAEAWPELAEARAQAVRAREDALRALVERGILGECRTWLNARLQEQSAQRYRKDIEAATATGLGQLDNPDWEIPTGTEMRLTRLLESLASGSVGISGPRGSGKTTLIRAFCRPGRRIENRDPKIQVMVSAPVRFDTADFLLHLFEKTCRAVLPTGVRVGPLDGSDDERLARFRRTARGIALLAAGTGLLLFGIGVWLAVGGIRDSSLDDEQQRLLLAGAVISVCSLAVAGGIVGLTRRAGFRDRFVVIASTLVLFHGLFALVVARESPGSYVDWLCAFAGLLAALGLLTAVGAAYLLSRPRIPMEFLLGGFFLAAGAVATGTWALGAVANSTLTGALFMLGAGIALPLTRLIVVQPTPSSTDSADALRARLVVIAILALRRAAMTMAIIVGGLGVAVATLGFFDRSLSGPVIAGIAFTAMGCALALAALGSNQQSRQLLDRRAQEQLGLRGRNAIEFLRRIRFLQTHSATWSGKVAVPGALKLPFTAEASLGGGVSATELPLTFPELVASFKEFLGREIGQSDRAVIGIDELDKIGSDEDAMRFLNEIKAVFGVPNCYFLISVSEDAVASFERRGMPFRDAFDSAFDDILRVAHLDLQGAEALLRKRTLEVPLPFVALCHVLSGGLPRDLVRIARRLFALRDEGRGTTLKALCPALVGEELAAKRDGTVTAVRRLGSEVDTAAALGWLGSWQRELVCERVADSPPPPGCASPDQSETYSAALSLDALVREFEAIRWLGGTLVEFFTEVRTQSDYECAEAKGKPTAIEQLTYARQALTIDPELACQRIASFRSAWNLEPGEVQLPARSSLDGAAVTAP